MPLELKLDNGAPVLGDGSDNGRTWKGPVYINTETQKELVVDANWLFESNAKLRSEAQTKREAYEGAVASLKAAGIELSKLDEVKRTLAEVDDLRSRAAKGKGEPRDPTPEEIDAATRVKFGEKEQVLEAKVRDALARAEAAEKKAKEHYAALSSTKVTSEFTRAASEAGVRKKNIPDVLLAAEREWELTEDLRFVTYEGQGDQRRIRRGTDPEKPMNPDEWLAAQKRAGRGWWDEPAAAGLKFPGGEIADPQNASTGELFAVTFPTPAN